MGKKRTVLVVDDDAAVRTMLRNVLEVNGFAVDCCANGITALKMVEDSHYDAIIAERCLPGMNGAVIARMLRVQLPQATIIGMTGEQCGGEMEETCHAMLKKPLVLSELITLLRSDQKDLL